jgi:biopolymer transport protein ExbD
MAEKVRTLDVLLVETRQAYRGVPYLVVTDWIQQGRLLGEDQVRATGGKAWYRIDAVPALAAFLPRSEPTRVEDRAEALEPVEVDFSWRRPPGEDEGDVDMIPLIDISLVLLIFFMMSAAVSAGVFSPIDTPPAEHQLLKLSEGMYWVGVDAADADKKGTPRYSFGTEKEVLVQPTLDLAQLNKGLQSELAKREGTVKIRIRGNQKLPIQTIQAVYLDLQGVERALNRQRDADRRLRIEILGEVSEPKR